MLEKNAYCVCMEGKNYKIVYSMVFMLICPIFQLSYHVYKVFCIIGFATISVRVALGGCSRNDVTALGVNLEAVQNGCTLVSWGCPQSELAMPFNYEVNTCVLEKNNGGNRQKVLYFDGYGRKLRFHKIPHWPIRPT